MLRVSMLIVGDVACGLIRFCHFQIDVTIPFTKLHILFEGDKTLREKKVALHTALSFKIPSHYREMCYFIARAVRMERAQPLIFKKISVLKIWSSGRFLVTLWVNIKQLR